MNIERLEKKILVLGGSGLLGSSLVPIFERKGRNVELHGRTNAAKYRADISDARDAFKLLDSVKPTVIVNLVGLTDVDRCEAQPNQAYLTNVRTVENIANWVKGRNTSCQLVHISTDQVYDGPGPHVEEQVTLTNYYAFSKYAGELAAAAVPSAILRANFVGRSHCARRASLTDWLFRSLSNGVTIQVVDDVMFSPLSMATLSEIIDSIIQKKSIGVFNVGSHEGTSKADFAVMFAAELNLSTRGLTRSPSDQMTSFKTYRPKDMRMDCSRLENALGVRLPLLRDEVRRVAKEYHEGA